MACLLGWRAQPQEDALLYNWDPVVTPILALRSSRLH